MKFTCQYRIDLLIVCVCGSHTWTESEKETVVVYHCTCFELFDLSRKFVSAGEPSLRSDYHWTKIKIWFSTEQRPRFWWSLNQHQTPSPAVLPSWSLDGEEDSVLTKTEGWRSLWLEAYQLNSTRICLQNKLSFFRGKEGNIEQKIILEDNSLHVCYRLKRFSSWYILQLASMCHELVSLRL